MTFPDAGIKPGAERRERPAPLEAAASKQALPHPGGTK